MKKYRPDIHWYPSYPSGIKVPKPAMAEDSERGEWYHAEDVDAKLKEYDEDNTGLSEAASKLCARIGTLETIIETQRQLIEALRIALRYWMPAGSSLEGDALMQWMADRELLSGE